MNLKCSDFDLFECRHPENEPFVYRTMIEDALVSCRVIPLKYLKPLYFQYYEKNALPLRINFHITQQLQQYKLFLINPIVLMFGNCYGLHIEKMELVYHTVHTSFWQLLYSQLPIPTVTNWKLIWGFNWNGFFFYTTFFNFPSFK